MKLPPHRPRSRTDVGASDRTEEAQNERAGGPPASPGLPRHPALLGAQFGGQKPADPRSRGLFSRLTSVRGPVSAAVLGAMLATSMPAVAQAPDARPSSMDPSVIVTELGRAPQLGAPLFEVAEGFAEQAQAEALARLRPEALFDQMEAGELRVRVPLRPGAHDVGGTRLRVDPGTVVYATVQIEDGRLVPYDDGDGTRVQLTKVIDGPVWTTARGVYLQDRGGGRGRAVVDVDGWFDKALGEARDLQVSGLVRSLLDNVEAAGGPAAGGVAAAAEDPGGLAGLVDWDGLEFQLAPVRMGDGVVDLGGLVLDLSEGTELRIVGNRDRAELTARFALDGAQVRQPGLRVDFGETSADLRIVSVRGADGDLRVRGGLENVNGHVERLVADYDRAGRAAHLDLRDARLTGARLDVSATLSGLEQGDLAMRDGAYRFRGDVEGQVAGSQVRLPDGDGDAELGFAAERFEGALDFSPDRVAIDARLDGAALSVRDLQPRAGGAFDLRSGRIAGDADLAFDTGTGDYRAHVVAEGLDLVLDDVRSEGDAIVDLGRTELRGRGEIWLSPDALRVEGDVAVAGRIDDLKVLEDAEDGGPARTVFDVAAGSTLQGDLRTLAISRGGGVELDARAEVDLALEGFGVDLPGFSAGGPTTLRGPAELEIEGDRVRLSDAGLVATMTVEDGQVAAGDGVLALDLGPGSNLSLAIREAAFGGPDGLQPALRLGPGSRLEARLDGGHVDVAARRVELEPGTRVRFDISSLEHGPGRAPELVGSLEIEAPVHLAPLVPAAQLRGLVGDGGASLRIDGVRMGQDGRLRMEGIGVAFEGALGQVERARRAPAPAPSRLGTLLAAHPELRTHQDLINHFYAVGGGEWAGASAAARGYGLSLSDLVADRDAAVEAPAAPPRAVRAVPQVGRADSAAEVLATAHPVPSLEAVQAAHAGRTLGVESAAAPLELGQLARQIDDGRLIFSVPLVGGNDDVSFDEGTVLYVVAEARDGRVVPDSFSAFLNKPGDASWFTTLEGAYLDEDNDLMLSVGWWWDQEVEGMQNLPMDLPSLVDRLTALGDAGGPGGGEAAGGGGLEELADLSRARVLLKDVTFREGRVPFGAGHIDVGEGTKVTVVGTQDNLQLSGHVDATELVVDTEGFAIDADRVSAEIFVEQRTDEDGARDARILLTNLDLDGRGVVYRNDDGDLVHLGAGEARGQVELVVKRHADGDTEVDARFGLSAFDGHVEAIRTQMGRGEDAPWVSIGPSRFTGHFALDADGQVSMQGHASSLDARVTGATIAGPAGPVELEEARLFGSGVLAMEGGRISFLGGPLSGAARLTADAQHVPDLFPGYLEDIDADGGQASFRFDLEHVDRLEHGGGLPLSLEGARGRIGGDISLDALSARISAEPFDSGVAPEDDGR